MRYLSGHYVFPVSSPPLRNGIVCVDDDGCIADVIDTGGKLEEREKLEFYNGILVPGFVNAHCHLELSHLRNAVEQRCGMQSFISSIIKMRKENHETIIDAARAADCEMAENGIIAVGDISNTADTTAVKKDSKIRYHTFVEFFGLEGDRAKEIFNSTQTTKKKIESAGLSASLAPHAPYSVSQELWEEFRKSNLESLNAITSMHHQESENEEILPCMIRCLQETSRCLLVHNIFSTEDILAEYMTNTGQFYFVLCPGSNLFIQNRLPVILEKFKKSGIDENICLGSDSLASNGSLSILAEMKLIQQHSPDIPLSMLLQWATLNGARALRFDDLYGSFDKGKTPGINLISGIDFENMKLTAESRTRPLETAINNRW